MARRGRPTVEITLTGNERKTLQRWVRRHSWSQALALRCRIVLGCTDGRANSEVAAELGIHPTTVAKWRHRFAAERLEGLVDAPRPGAARKISDDVVEAVVVEAWRPRRRTRRTGRPGPWLPSTGSRIRPSRRSGERSGSSPGGPTSTRSPPTPDLVEKIRDMVGLYVNPPVAAVVFAVDEQPQIQALNRTAPTLPMLPTTPARATHDYQRNGTCDLFAALNTVTWASSICLLTWRHVAMETERAIFAKIGVSSRGEPTAKLFAELYEPVHGESVTRAHAS